MLLTDTPVLDLSPLRNQVKGDVTAPGDERWDEARQAWNLAVDQRPLAVVEPLSAADIAAAVRFAAERGLHVAPQGTGHNAHPLDLTNAILVKTHRMRAVEIDAERRVARAEAGALWMDVTAPASEHGLAALAGSSPDVGVVGYTLGGGIGWLSRELGLATNSVIAIEVATADGKVRRVDAGNDPDLFWALRGGNGNFGMVTAIEFRLYALPGIYAGAMLWPIERAPEVLHAWREWTAEAPDEVTTSARILRVPPLEDIPEVVRGRDFIVIDGAVIGSAEHGAEVLARFTGLAPEINMFGPVPPVALSYIHMDPDGPAPAVAGATLMLDELSAEAVDDLLDAAGPESGSPLMMAELRHVGGALARAAEGHGALAKLDAEYVFFAAGMAASPEMAAVSESAIDRATEAMRPYENGRRYSNFTEKAVDARAIYGEDVHARLREVKAGYDPDDVFRANHRLND